ncbi:GNAT family N-acetyltransferase [Bacillus sp. DTU_2020_1000418_1_SI_GHA_SEK_038]|uniref:GNAT family N-acetyltransferase n=1 Tax=Bacillus sp. DTU_2020_1000418_1_SI_GHA_SEK_038 TaxID=3077585 RepID=UPI00397738E6
MNLIGNFEIRTLHTSSEMKLVQKLEEEVWKMSAIPIHQTVTAAKNGGIMLGAFHQEKLVGFSYGFTGFEQNQIYLCSHMLGIHPEYQEKGIGAKLKEAQKRVAAEMGYELIIWTFDPLESRNAYLNMNKLRGICCTYIENCYGEMEDGLNSGLPSDRFKIDWWINSEHVADSQSLNEVQSKEGIHLISWETTSNELPKLGDIDQVHPTLANVDQPLFVPVPANFQELKKTDHELAIDWRSKTRKIFQQLFEAGYAVVALQKTTNEPVHYYVLTKLQTLSIKK